MKSAKNSVVALLLLSLLLLAACGGQQSEMTWQEQYDLGVRYLSEGNYEEAIIAFTAAIEIDPKRAEAYVGRGDAYIGSGETAENLAAAEADYLTAIDLDETLVDVWLSIADLYRTWGDLEGAQRILEEGYAATGAEELQQALTSQTLEPLEGYPKTERQENSDGSYRISEYDQYGNLICEERYTADGILIDRTLMQYDERGWLVEEYSEHFEDDAACQNSTKYYNENRQLIQEVSNWGANRNEPYTSTITYQYDGTAVSIDISILYDSGSSAYGSFAYTMESPDHYVEATGIGWSTSEGNAHVRHLWEYRMEEAALDNGRVELWPEAVKDLRYDSDGNIETLEEDG